MANGKTIKGYANKTKLQNSDAFLFQRDNEYFYVNAQALLSGSTISDTRANVNTLKTGSNLSVGGLYYLTDKYIWVNALDVDKTNYNALFLARNADYNSAGVYSGITVANGFTVTATGTNLGVWTSVLAPASGDVVIWNNLHWLNITGANGASDPTVDTTNWESVSNTDITTAFTYGYIQEIDRIEYDFDSDLINKREDKRGNVYRDIFNIGGIDQFPWGDDTCTNNVGVYTMNWVNQLYNSISGNTATAQLTIASNDSSFTFNNNYVNMGLTNGLTVYAYNKAVAIQQSTWSGSTTQHYVKEALNQVFALDNGHSNIETSIPLVTAAYNGATTYSFGDFITTGTVTYMYINADESAGNPAPDASYWFAVYDFTTAGRFKLNVQTYFADVGVFNLSSSNATETIDELVLDSNTTSSYEFRCDTALVTTFVTTAIASLANAGEIIGTSSRIVDGGQYEFAQFQREQIGGTNYTRWTYGRTDYV